MINIGNGQVITISGSTSFKEEMIIEEKRLALEGYIVLPLSIFSHADSEDLGKEELDMLFQNHLKKIRMCDILFVVDVDGYIGTNTEKEIDYARSINKEIRFLYHEELNRAVEISPYSKKKQWSEFLETGLLLQVNQILHNFGFAITVCRDKQGNFIEAYPARVTYRGFVEKSIDKSYSKVAKYLKENSEELSKDCEE